ncbi:MAG: hypothetical protein RIC19_03975 [Phaeodactylibacter sp.]|uniref:hypothetical protein n=1 Tax=Phaeodactylibacter sp. TaxID=1940289 RepID=UPI0032EFE605
MKPQSSLVIIKDGKIRIYRFAHPPTAADGGGGVTIAYRQNKDYYNLSDVIVNLCCGLLERLFDFFWIIVSFFIFTFVHDHFTEKPTAKTIHKNRNNSRLNQM